MRFARIEFVAAGLWGIAILSVVLLLREAIAAQHSSPIADPEFFYGFLAVTFAWQIAFLVIGSNPSRFRLMMIPGALEKFGYMLIVGGLYWTDRITGTDAALVTPDLAWGVLFMIAFAKTRA